MTSIAFKQANIFATIPDGTVYGKTYPANDKIVYSPNRKYTLTFQKDGNLVIYNAVGSATWSSGTWGNTSAVLVLQPDGNLVIYKDNTFATALWSSVTFGIKNVDMFLTIDDNGIAVLYNKDSTYKPIWTSNGLKNYTNPYSSVSIDSASSSSDASSDAKKTIIPGLSNTIFWVIIGIIIALFVGGSGYTAYKNRVAIKATADRMKAAAQARMVAMRSKQVAPAPAITAPINLPINQTSVQTVGPMNMPVNPMGMNQMNMPANQMGMNPMGMNPMGMNPMGMNPMGMNPMGMNPGMNQMGMNQMGMNQMGMNQMGQQQPWR